MRSRVEGEAPSWHQQLVGQGFGFHLAVTWAGGARQGFQKGHDLIKLIMELQELCGERDCRKAQVRAGCIGCLSQSLRERSWGLPLGWKQRGWEEMLGVMTSFKGGVNRTCCWV